MTLIEILNTEEGKDLINSIEEAEQEIIDRGIDPDDDTSFWASARKLDILTLKLVYGYEWK